MAGGKQKDLNLLRREIEKDGYRVVPSGSGHWRILNEKGVVVVDKDGPVIMSSTSSEARGRDMAVQRLMAAGVLKRDPWAPDKGDTSGRETSEMSEAELAAYEREREVTRAADQARAQRTLRVRERIEPVISRLGGWEKRGMMTEIGQVSYYFAEQLELTGRWGSEKAASENAGALRGGATLSDTMAALWEKLVDELESWPDTKLRWMQLLREAKGLEPPTVGDKPLTSRSSPTLSVVPIPPLEPEEQLPTLALRAMFEMGVGRPADDPDRRHVLAIGEEILKLEILARSDRPASHNGEADNEHRSSQTAGS